MHLTGSVATPLPLGMLVNCMPIVLQPAAHNRLVCLALLCLSVYACACLSMLVLELWACTAGVCFVLSLECASYAQQNREKTKSLRRQAS